MGGCAPDGDGEGRDDCGEEVDGGVDVVRWDLLVREMGLGDVPCGEVLEDMPELAFHLMFMQERVFAVLGDRFLGW
jgi:hypothetical protein